MRLACVINARIPTEKAHGYQIMRVMSEWTTLGHEVVLYVPARRNPIQEDPFDYYGIETKFPIVYVPCIDALRFARFLGPLAFWITNGSFLRNARIPKDHVVYTRDADTVAYLGRQGYKCVYNAHNWAPGREAKIKGALGIVCNSKGTERAAAAAKLPTTVAYNAADENPWAGSDKRALRQELGLQQDKRIILYVGHLYEWKGAHTLARAAAHVPDALFVFVGGNAQEVASMGPVASNVALLGQRPHAQVGKYMAAADVLVLPNAPVGESVDFTSPLKLFEYMAAGVPIVASDLPSLREVLSDKTTSFVSPGDPTLLAQAIGDTLNKKEEAAARAHAALEESRGYTWKAHAERVAAFIGSVLR